MYQKTADQNMNISPRNWKLNNSKGLLTSMRQTVPRGSMWFNVRFRNPIFRFLVWIMLKVLDLLNFPMQCHQLSASPAEHCLMQDCTLFWFSSGKENLDENTMSPFSKQQLCFLTNASISIGDRKCKFWDLFVMKLFIVNHSCIGLFLPIAFLLLAYVFAKLFHHFRVLKWLFPPQI